MTFGNIDTCNVFREILPDRIKNKLSFSQEVLVKDYLPEENVNDLHDALQDIKTLKKLVNILNISNKNLVDHCKTHHQLYESEKISF